MLPNISENTMINSKINVHTLPCMSDNYAYVIHNHSSGTAAVVDIPEAGPIVEKISELGVIVTEVFLTHHHGDHIDGLDDLQMRLTTQLGQAPCRVIGAKADAYRLPPLDYAVTPGQTIKLCEVDGQIFDASGHTLGHVALHMPEIKAVFTADSLMAMGCGRLFEGTAAQMWQTLLQFRCLPNDTMIYSGHEYTASNMAFALSLGEANPAVASRAAQITKDRAAGRATVPSLLELELQTNPFLRADDPALQSALGMSGAAASDVFAAIRTQKDKF
jgi:hydroxyacylglutathione hydrolase